MKSIIMILTLQYIHEKNYKVKLKDADKDFILMKRKPI
jgi:hypothetical protein